MKTRIGNILKLAATLLLVSLVAACGGGSSGGGGGGSSSSSSSSESYASAASQAGVQATVNLFANRVTLRWTDAFPAGTTFTIRARNADGRFVSLETVPGVGTPSIGMNWQGVFTGATSYQIVANTNGVLTLLKSHSLHSTIDVTIPDTLPTITIDSPEPLAGNVTLSVVGAPGGFPVPKWYVDGAPFGSPGTSVVWNANQATSGTHALLVELWTSDDSLLEVGRSVTVAEHTIAVNATVLQKGPPTYGIYVEATAISGVASVSATLDGNSLGTLTAPNDCAYLHSTCLLLNRYRFDVNGTVVGSGDHTAVITATDTQGHTGQTTIPVVVSNAPVITLTSPVANAFAYGTLAVSGTVVSDKPGTVITTRVALSDQQILQTSSTSFSANYDISGLTPGTYTLSVTSKDSSSVQGTSTLTRQIVVTSSPSLAYTPLVTIGANGGMRAADGNRLVYAAPDGSVRILTASGGEVILTDADKIASTGNWRLASGAVSARGKGPDCPRLFCVYRWDASGHITNLSTANPYRLFVSGDADEAPIARGGYVVWVEAQTQLIVYKLADGSYTKIPLPAGASRIGNADYDIDVSGGKLTVFFYASSGSGSATTYAVYNWASDTGLTEKLSDDSWNFHPQSDGAIVTWVSGKTSPAAIKTQPFAGGAVTSLASIADTNPDVFLQDGVLVWKDYGFPTTTIKAWHNGVTATVTTTSAVQGLRLYGTSNGFVVYADGDGKVYSWNAATNQKKLLVEFIPQQVIVADGYVYFSAGSTVIVYRVLLN